MTEKITFTNGDQKKIVKYIEKNHGIKAYTVDGVRMGAEVDGYSVGKRDEFSAEVTAHVYDAIHDAAYEVLYLICIFDKRRSKVVFEF